MCNPSRWNGAGRAQLMKANFDRLVSGAVEAARMAIETTTPAVDMDKMMTLSLAVSCIGRRIVLGERTEGVNRLDLGTERSVLFGAQAGPYAEKALARDLCNKLKTRDVDCFLIRP